MQSEKGAFRVAHREIVGGMGVDDTFRVVAWELNPGLPGTFPWLSSVALGFEMYRFNRFTVRYTPVCSTAVGGFVQLVPEYDITDSLPGSVTQASSYLNSKGGQVYAPMSIDLDIKSMMGGLTRKYVNSTQSYIDFIAATTVNPPLGNNIEPRTSSSAFYCCTSNGASGFRPCGIVEFDYDVTFFTPHTAPPAPASAIKAATSVTPLAATPFGPVTAGSQRVVGNLIAGIDTTAPAKVQFKNLVAGAQYLITAITDTTSGGNSLTLGGAMTLLEDIFMSTGSTGIQTMSAIGKVVGDYKPSSPAWASIAPGTLFATTYPELIISPVPSWSGNYAIDA